MTRRLVAPSPRGTVSYVQEVSSSLQADRGDKLITVRVDRCAGGWFEVYIFELRKQRGNTIPWNPIPWKVKEQPNPICHMNKLFIVVSITLIALALSAPEDYVEPSIEDEVSEDFE